MDPLLHQCSVRFKALKDLRGIHGSRFCSRRVTGGRHCQRRGVNSVKLPPASRSISRFHPTRSVSLAQGVASPGELKGPGGSEHEGLESVSSSKRQEEKDFGAFKRIYIQSKNVVKATKASLVKVEMPGQPDGHVEYIRIRRSDFHPVFLRDACTCAKCVDPSSKQKNFQTTDIPINIKGHLNMSFEGVAEIVWENDIPGFGPDHKSLFPKQFFDDRISAKTMHRSRYETGNPKIWDKNVIAKELEYVSYDEYMNTDEGLFRALRQLRYFGLILLREVPQSEKSVEEVALRIGNLRDTFYGRTWDVKSVPQAKNVAYTAQYLGLHMDLLYMSDPPGFQFLHCLQNTCEGGSSLFSDAFYAASQLSTNAFFQLAKQKVAYHYHNAGEHYYFQHPVLQVPAATVFNPGAGASGSDRLQFVNYSPPFQANHIAIGPAQVENFPTLLEAMREFATAVESEENLYEYRLQEGECVIFNNRRVLHGRRQFDTATGMRWIKGAYIDTDVFMSRYRVLSEKFAGSSLNNARYEGRKLVNPRKGSTPSEENESNLL